MKKKVHSIKKQMKDSFIIVEKEISFQDPIRGKVTQKVPVKVYPKQEAPEIPQYTLPINLDELENDEDTP